MGPDGVISLHSLGNGLIMSIWRRLGMGSSPYSPVIPLVICLPLRPLTGTLMAPGCSQAFLVCGSARLSNTQTPHPTPDLHEVRFLWRTLKRPKLSKILFSQGCYEVAYCMIVMLILFLDKPVTGLGPSFNQRDFYRWLLPFFASFWYFAENVLKSLFVTPLYMLR